MKKTIKENMIAILLLVIAIENLIYLLIAELRDVYSIECSFVFNLILLLIMVFFWIKNRSMKKLKNNEDKCSKDDINNL